MADFTDVTNVVTANRSSINSMFTAFLNNNEVIRPTHVTSFVLQVKSQINKLLIHTGGRSLLYNVRLELMNDFDPKSYKLLIDAIDLYTHLFFNGYNMLAEAIVGLDEYTIVGVGKFYYYEDPITEEPHVGVEFPVDIEEEQAEAGGK